MSWSLETAARTLYGECRGEPIEGQRAVAHVLNNRARSGHFGANLAQVCLAHAQFSCWMQDQGDLIDWRAVTSVDDADPILTGLRNIMASVASGADPDPTGGATFYYAKSMPTPPPWAATMNSCGQFGHQVFFKPK